MVIYFTKKTKYNAKVNDYYDFKTICATTKYHETRNRMIKEKTSNEEITNMLSPKTLIFMAIITLASALIYASGHIIIQKSNKSAVLSD